MTISPHRPVAMVADSPPPDNLETNTDSFEVYCSGKYLAARTIKTYLEAVNGFTDYLREQGVTEIKAITQDHVNGYLASLRERGCKRATLANRFRSLQQFFKFLRGTPDPRANPDDETDTPQKRINHNPMDGLTPPRIKEPETPILEEAQLKAILRTCNGTSFRDRRDAAILRVFMDTGRRLFEVAGLTVADVDLKRRKLSMLVKGRGEQEDYKTEVPINAKAVQALDRYLYERQRRGIEGQELWWGKRGPQTPAGIAQMVRERAEKADIPGVHPHMFRHSFAHIWKSNGGNEEDLMEIAGWKSRELLDRYGKAGRKKRAEEAHARLRLGDRL